MAQSNVTSFANSEDQTDDTEGPVCQFCGLEMDGRATIESRPTRELMTLTCSHRGCKKGRAASLVIDSPASDTLESELDTRRDHLQRGLTPRRLAGAIRSRHGTGTYQIQKVRAHSYEIRGSETWKSYDAATVAAEIASVAPHIETAPTGRVVTVSDTRFKTDTAESRVVDTTGIPASR